MTTLQTILLKNNQGMSVEILNLGARIKSILFPVKGQMKEMAVGYSHAEDYQQDDFYLGATCGRVCNRIENGSFELNGVCYNLTTNDNENTLHGGVDNFSHRIWQIVSSSDSSVTLMLESKNGDQGFPGKLTLHVTYTLTDTNALEINYLAVCDAPTPINITNHAYFNLGSKSGELLDLYIASSSMLERKNNGLPSGKVISVDKSDFDFRQLTNIGKRQANATDSNLKAMACFDHCYVLDSEDVITPKAILESKETGIKMSLFTDQQAIQFYSGVGLSGDFSAYQGICLEAQNYTNAINISHFPNSVLLPKEEYTQTIIYQFETLV